MLTAARAFRQSGTAAPLLPLPAELDPLWEIGVRPRHGQLVMVAGRPGSQKSGFTLFWVRKMGLPTLYFSGDMSPFEATVRLAEMEVGETAEQIEDNLRHGWETHRYEDALADIDIQFSFGQPITWNGIQEEIDAWVETRNGYPPVIVVDNLMDIEGAESDYQVQTEAMQNLASLSREYGVTVIVLHHATDKTTSAEVMPGMPAPRREIKNGLAEKPALVLSIALEPETCVARIACVKQRSGPADASARTYATLQAIPEHTRFKPHPGLTWEGVE